jgi:phosphate acetyltransferase
MPVEKKDIPVEMRLKHHGRYETFIHRVMALPPLRTAVVQPCSTETLRSAVEMKKQDLVDPIPIGPEQMLKTIAEDAEISLTVLEADNMFAKQFIYFAGADAAELVLGGRIPVLVTSRKDPAKVRTALIRLAKLMVTGRCEAACNTIEVPI